MAEWFSAPATSGTVHHSSQVRIDEENTSLSATNGRSKPPNANSDDGRHAIIARVPLVSVSAQTPIEKFLGSCGHESAAANASIRSKLRSARIADSDLGHVDSVAVKEGMSNVLLL